MLTPLPNKYTPSSPIKGKAISIRQPWAWAIFHGKPVENRTWYSNYRGPLWIHASKTFDYEGYQWMWKNIDRLGLFMLPALKRLPVKAIIGRVNMVDCVKEYDSPWFSGPYGHVYEDPILLSEPIPYKGQLRIFNVDIPISK